MSHKHTHTHKHSTNDSRLAAAKQQLASIYYCATLFPISLGWMFIINAAERLANPSNTLQAPNSELQAQGGRPERSFAKHSRAARAMQPARSGRPRMESPSCTERRWSSANRPLGLPAVDPKLIDLLTGRCGSHWQHDWAPRVARSLASSRATLLEPLERATQRDHRGAALFKLEHLTQLLLLLIQLCERGRENQLVCFKYSRWTLVG